MAPQEKHIVFHLGPRKTGTTTIQAMLEQNEEILAPDIAVFPRHRLTYRWRLRASHFKDGRTTPRDPSVRRAATRVARRIASLSARTVIISDENLAGSAVARPQGETMMDWIRGTIELIEDVFAGFRLSYVLYYRDEDRWFRSCYNQDVKNKACPLTYDDWRGRYPAEIGLEAAARELAARFDGRVTVVRMEDEARAGRLGTAVLEVAGVERETLQRIVFPAPQNESLGPSLLEFVRQLNGLPMKQSHRQRIVDLARAHSDQFDGRRT